MEKFACFWRGIFFLVSTVSLIVMVSMFIFVWQPIWTSGFKDFHTISRAIDQLDETIRPASNIAPQLLVQITEMNHSMSDIQKSMHTMEEIRSSMEEMRVSMQELEAMNPNIIKMSDTMSYMTLVMSSQMGKMTNEVDQMGNKFTPFSMLPFNW